jgi:hypothetical protein
MEDYRAVNIIIPYSCNKSTQLQLSQENQAMLELQCIKGGPVYLFMGSLTIAECEAQLTGQINYDLAAAVGQNAFCKVPGNTGVVTVYSPTAESIGHIRLIVQP